MSIPTDEQLRAVSYNDALAARAAESTRSAAVVELDRWYRHDLRTLFAQRKADEGAGYIDQPELGKLMQWKLSRGKWRPGLLQKALTNSSKDIKSAFLAAFPSSTKSSTPIESLKALSTLFGIGPATASALLALVHPETEPFLSDEACEACGLKAEYTLKAWERFRDAMTARREKGAWESMEELERQMWAWKVLQRTGGTKENGKEDKGIKKGKKRKSTGAEEKEAVQEALPVKRMKRQKT